SGSGDDIVIGDHGVVVWTNGALTLTGSIEPTFGTDDRISTGDGNDIVFGGDGSDIISSGAGNDLVFGDHRYVASGPDFRIDPKLLPGGPALSGFGWQSVFTGVADGGAADIIDAGAGDDV